MPIADRREDRAFRTDRPDGAEVLPTVREVLRLEVIAEGAPDVLVGGAALDARVRWVHASDSVSVARLLDGGELLLTTASAWPAEPALLEAFIRELADAGVAGVVVELGTIYRWVPTVVVRTARELGLALVALAREIKFVSVTETVHRQIMAAQTGALRARDEVRERFTALALRGAPADFVVEQLGQSLGAPVVLENLAHEVVAADVPLATEQDLFGAWQQRSRDAHHAAHDRARTGARPGADDWLVVPVEARGVRWGHLIALPGPPHPAGRVAVMEQAAIALALGRLTEGADDEWARLGQRLLVDRFLEHRYASTSDIAARWAAAGFVSGGRTLYGLVLAGSPLRPEAVESAARTMSGGVLVGSALRGVSDPATPALLSIPADSRLDDAAIRAFGAAVAIRPEDLVLSVGAAAADVEGALASLQEAIALSRGDAGITRPGPVVRRSAGRPLMRLVTALRDDPRLLEMGEGMLAPLIEYDLAKKGDLCDVLAAVLAHPSNRTAAAAAAHLSRSVFYQRIALIEELLDADLDDGETQTALHLALYVRRGAVR